jgi:hypothetical protein
MNGILNVIQGDVVQTPVTPQVTPVNELEEERI